MSASAAARKKQYPDPDRSKTFVDVPKVKFPKKSFFAKLISRMESSVSVNALEPWERALSYIIIGAILYFFMFLLRYFASFFF